MAPGGVIFIKENVSDTDDTQIVTGDYKGAADLSLARSMDCFKAIFTNASYSTIVCEKWPANPNCFPILSASLRVEPIMPNKRHTHCIGAKHPSEWSAIVAKQK